MSLEPVARHGSPLSDRTRPPKLDLASCPYLPRANVEATSAASHMTLMTAVAE